MTRSRLFHFLLLRLLPILVFGLLARQAMAQADPPGRVARINHAQGPVVFSPAGDNEWTDAVPNRPLTRGDRVWTDRGSRAEIQIGSSAVRLDGQTHLEILALDDQSAQLSVTQGVAYVRVRSLPEGENFEIDTPNLAYRAAYPGDYRIDVDPNHGTTRVTIHSGTGAVYGENGQALPLGGGQQVTFKGRSLAQLNAQEAPPQDTFDRWAAERNRQEDQSISARFVPREVVGYQQLDANGKWAHDLTHGVVWIPHNTPADWAPYRHGHWEWISPWGWTWIDAAPWGFAPFHYGRWTLIESRWAWVPGRLGLRPVYAPALVAFVGSSGVNWGFSLAGGRPGMAWFPLAPGEAFQPGYRASPVYISNVNRNIAVQPNAGYAYQRSADALTAISAEDFHRGQPVRAGWLRVAANLLTNAQIVPPPPMPEPNSVLAQNRPAPARVTPPAAAEIRQVVAQAAAPASAPLSPAGGEGEREAAQREAAQREAAKRQALAQEKARARAAQAHAQKQADAERLRLAAEQERARREEAQAVRQMAREKAAAKAQPATAQAAPAAPAKAAQATSVVAAVPAPAAPVRTEPTQQKTRREAVRAEQARREQVAQRAEQAKREQVAQRAEQAKRDQAAQRAEQAKRDQAAQRAEQAKREQLARRAEQARRAEAAQRAEQAKQLEAKREAAKREQVAARRAEQAKRVAQAKRDEQQRREAHAQRVEQARRAADREAQTLREQREEQARAAAEREAQALREQRARREADERQQAQREAWQRQQQALAEQWRREHQQWEQQQRDRVRQRPDLRDDRRAPPPPQQPEVWQRGIPILNPGRTS